MYYSLRYCIWAIAIFAMQGIPSAYAVSTKVEMLTAIIDPTLLDEQTALEMCEENPEMVKCEVVKERLQEKITQTFHEYDVLVANFE